MIEHDVAGKDFAVVGALCTIMRTSCRVTQSAAAHCSMHHPVQVNVLQEQNANQDVQISCRHELVTWQDETFLLMYAFITQRAETCVDQVGLSQERADV